MSEPVGPELILSGRLVRLETAWLRSLLLDAFVDGFLLEHGMKNASRYPLAMLTRDGWKEQLEPAFLRWLETTPNLSDADGERLRR